MSGQSIALNAVPNEPTLSDLLDLLKKEILLGMNCHHIGTVQSFNVMSMTVVATINYTKTYFTLDDVTNLYVATQVNYPTTIDCPIICLGGGKANLTMPIAKGDECLLLFNDRDMDNWYASGQLGPAATARLHSFSDAIALVGLKSTPNLLTTYDAIRAVLTDGTVKVGINPSTHKATISNQTTTLNTLLQSILTQLQTLSIQCAAITCTGVTTGGGTSGPPANAVALAAVGTQLGTLATQLGSLLE